MREKDKQLQLPSLEGKRIAPGILGDIAEMYLYAPRLIIQKIRRDWRDWKEGKRVLIDINF